MLWCEQQREHFNMNKQYLVFKQIKASTRFQFFLMVATPVNNRSRFQFADPVPISQYSDAFILFLFLKRQILPVLHRIQLLWWLKKIFDVLFTIPSLSFNLFLHAVLMACPKKRRTAYKGYGSSAV